MNIEIIDLKYGLPIVKIVKTKHEFHASTNMTFDINGKPSELGVLAFGRTRFEALDHMRDRVRSMENAFMIALGNDHPSAQLCGRTATALREEAENVTAQATG